MVSNYLLSQFSEYISDRTGLYFPEEKYSDLTRAINFIAKEFDFSNVNECIEWIIASELSKDQYESLVVNLTIGETYFFRQKDSLAALEQTILPEKLKVLEKNGKSIRIWSAACASGEESYSIAILLDRIIPDIKDWNITILATDLNTKSLSKAQKGIYSNWSFRDAPEWVLNKYFKPVGNEMFEISEDIKKMVTFSYINLAENNFPSLLNNTNAMDLIFCCNVLMYFKPQLTHKVINNLNNSLVNDGWLVVAPAESMLFKDSKFIANNFPGSIIFNKKENVESQTSKPFFPEAGNNSANSILPSDINLTTNLTVTPYQIQEREPQFEYRINNDSDDNNLQKAKNFYDQGKYIELINLILNLNSEDKINPIFSTLLSKAYANLGRLNDASDICKKSLEKDKLNPDMHYLLAMIQQEQGKFDDSLSSLRSALYADSKYIVAYYATGSLYNKMGKNQEAKKYFNNTISLMQGYKSDEILLGSEGMTVGRIREHIESILE